MSDKDSKYDASTELLEAINSNLVDTVIDLSEIDLRAGLISLTGKDSLLADIPVLKWMISGSKIVSRISTILSIRKFSAFIKPIKDSAVFENEDSKEKLLEICGTKKKLDFVIEQTLFSLDKYDTEIKARWLARMFVATFKEKNFSVDEYNAIQFSINSLNPITSVKTLEFYYNYYKQKKEVGIINDRIELQRINMDYSPLVLSGFLHLPKGGTFCDNPGGASINDLGIRFYENIIKE